MKKIFKFGNTDNKVVNDKNNKTTYTIKKETVIQQMENMEKGKQTNIHIDLKNTESQNRFENDAAALFGDIQLTNATEEMLKTFRSLTLKTNLLTKLKQHHLLWNQDVKGERALRYVIIDVAKKDVFIDSVEIISIDKKEYDDVLLETVSSRDALTLDNTEYVIDLQYAANKSKKRVRPTVKYKVSEKGTKNPKYVTDQSIIKKLNEKSAKRGGLYFGMPLFNFENFFANGESFDSKTTSFENLRDLLWNELWNEWTKTKAWVEQNDNISNDDRDAWIAKLQKGSSVKATAANSIFQSALEGGATSGLPTIAYLISAINFVEAKLMELHKEKKDNLATGSNKMNPETFKGDIPYWNKISTFKIYYEMKLTLMFRQIMLELFKDEAKYALEVEVKVDFNTATKAYFETLNPKNNNTKGGD